MNDSAANEALEYPQRVPLKVVGDNGEHLREALNAALARHLPDGTTIEFETHESSGGKYVAFTATFVADSREQLTNVYTELRQCKAVRFLL
ncbi:MAG: YbeD family protein [Gammaproteobacteria bacterium]